MRTRLGLETDNKHMPTELPAKPFSFCFFLYYSSNTATAPSAPEETAQITVVITTQHLRGNLVSGWSLFFTDGFLFVLFVSTVFVKRVTFQFRFRIIRYYTTHALLRAVNEMTVSRDTFNMRYTFSARYRNVRVRFQRGQCYDSNEQMHVYIK